MMKRKRTSSIVEKEKGLCHKKVLSCFGKEHFDEKARLFGKIKGGNVVMQVDTSDMTVLVRAMLGHGARKLNVLVVYEVINGHTSAVFYTQVGLAELVPHLMGQ